MRSYRFGVLLMLSVLASMTAAFTADSVQPGSAMKWRQIGPSRAGRARALSGVASQPNVFYAGFDNGGVWRSTDYGVTWTPLTDRECGLTTGAMALDPKDPTIV